MASSPYDDTLPFAGYKRGVYHKRCMPTVILPIITTMVAYSLLGVIGFGNGAHLHWPTTL